MPFKPKVRVKVRVTMVTCGRCGKGYNNALGHTCVIRTDFKKRKKQTGR